MDIPYKKIGQAVGAVGTLACLVIFVREPSFPTPDKLFIFLLLVFMAAGQGWALFKRLAPFITVILVYESFRSVADQLNSHINYQLAPDIDKFIFGSLPTASLQRLMWSGHVQWYDTALYIPYLVFFLAPILLALIIWKTRDHYYWRAVTAYSTLFFLSFLTFLVMPTAPPWMAAQHHVIQPIVRISSYVWARLGIHNFPSLYNHLSPNPVAAFPSLHSGASTLFSIIVFRLYGWRWGAVSLIYPLSIYLGVVYEGEHYASDVLAGIIYAAAAYYLSERFIFPWLKRLQEKLVREYSSSTKNVLRSAKR